jgi:hypothetical protein
MFPQEAFDNGWVSKLFRFTRSWKPRTCAIGISESFSRLPQTDRSPFIFERWRRLQGPLSSVAVEPPEAETEGSHRPRVALNADWCRFMLAISKLSDILSRSWEGPRSHFGCSNPWAFVVSIRGALGFIC